MYCIVKSISSSIYYTYSPNVGVTYDGRVLKVAGTIVPPNVIDVRAKLWLVVSGPVGGGGTIGGSFLHVSAKKKKRAKKIKEAVFIRWSRLLE